jgi:hypothetical protein
VGSDDQSGHIFILTHASLFLWWEILPSFSNSMFFSTPAAKVPPLIPFDQTNCKDKSRDSCALVVFVIKHFDIFSYNTGEDKRIDCWIDWMVYC